MVNRVILVGRLTADPDLKATPKGSFIATLRLVTNSYGGRDPDGERKEHTEFHRLVVFGRQAEVAGQFLKKGKLIYTDGRLQTRSWDDSGGQKRYSTEVVVESFQILSPKGEGETAQA